MIEVDTLHELLPMVGRTLGASRWHLVDQALIDRFADVTGDHAWYHVDAPRAAAEMPDGRTIAHGLLTLSLVPALTAEIVRVRRHGRALVAGYDRVRFIEPVRCGDRLQLTLAVEAATIDDKGRVTLVYGCTMALEGSTRPAMVALLRLVLPA
ncbi:MAG: MaoC family dehydratase [Burkholderiaceae bacterium]